MMRPPKAKFVPKKAPAPKVKAAVPKPKAVEEKVVEKKEVVVKRKIPGAQMMRAGRDAVGALGKKMGRFFGFGKKDPRKVPEEGGASTGGSGGASPKFNYPSSSSGRSGSGSIAYSSDVGGSEDVGGDDSGLLMASLSGSFSVRSSHVEQISAHSSDADVVVASNDVPVAQELTPEPSSIATAGTSAKSDVIATNRSDAADRTRRRSEDASVVVRSASGPPSTASSVRARRDALAAQLADPTRFEQDNLPDPYDHEDPDELVSGYEFLKQKDIIDVAEYPLLAGYDAEVDPLQAVMGVWPRRPDFHFQYPHGDKWLMNPFRRRGAEPDLWGVRRGVAASERPGAATIAESSSEGDEGDGRKRN